MANHPGARVYPIQTDFTPARDAGPTTKNPPTGLPRGGTTADYNVKLRGVRQRIDEKPERPYP